MTDFMLSSYYGLINHMISYHFIPERSRCFSNGSSGTSHTGPLFSFNFRHLEIQPLLFVRVLCCGQSQ